MKRFTRFWSTLYVHRRKWETIQLYIMYITNNSSVYLLLLEYTIIQRLKRKLLRTDWFNYKWVDVYKPGNKSSKYRIKWPTVKKYFRFSRNHLSWLNWNLSLKFVIFQFEKFAFIAATKYSWRDTFTATNFVWPRESST